MLVIPHTVLRAISMFKSTKDVRYYLKGCLLETGPKGAYKKQVRYSVASTLMLNRMVQAWAMLNSTRMD